MSYVILDGYTVRHTTEAAIGIQKTNKPLDPSLTWLPRALCRDGDAISKGDTDLEVLERIAEDKGLDY